MPSGDQTGVKMSEGASLGICFLQGVAVTPHRPVWGSRAPSMVTAAHFRETQVKFSCLMA